VLSLPVPAGASRREAEVLWFVVAFLTVLSVETGAERRDISLFLTVEVVAVAVDDRRVVTDPVPAADLSPDCVETDLLPWLTDVELKFVLVFRSE